MAKKSFKYLLTLFDGVWSVPLAFFAFWILGILLQTIFGFATGTYDMGFIQPLLLAIGVVIGATNAAVFGLYFTFRGLFRFLYGFKDIEGNVINYSKLNWEKLSPWKQYVIAFTVFFYFVSVVIIVYLKMV